MDSDIYGINDMGTDQMCNIHRMVTRISYVISSLIWCGTGSPHSVPGM